LLILMALLIFAKWWKFTTKIKSITLLIYILKIQNIWKRFLMISKIELKIFQINFIVRLFMCLTLELLKLFLDFYSFKFVISIFWQLFRCLNIFSWICIIFSIFSQQELPSEENSKPRKHVGYRGLRGGANPTI
jgi:hypothetical protein